MKGLKIVGINENTQAVLIGFQLGDVLVSLDGNDLVSQDSLKDSIDTSLSEGNIIGTYKYLRKGATFEASARLNEPLGIELQPCSIASKLATTPSNLSSSTRVNACTTANSPSHQSDKASQSLIPVVSLILFGLALISLSLGLLTFFFVTSDPFRLAWTIAGVINAVIFLTLGTIVHILSDIRHYVRSITLSNS